MVREIAGHELRISSPYKVFFSKRGETKLDLIDYYLAVAEPIMATMGGRPTLMERYPDGASGKSFFQKRVPKGAPTWLETTTMSTPNGTTSNAMVAADVAHLAWAAHMGCLGFHVWPLRADAPEHTDELRIDLDPSPGIEFDDIRWAALAGPGAVRRTRHHRFPEDDREPRVAHLRSSPAGLGQLSGAAAAVALARELERRHPDRLTAAWWKEERGQRVFIDFNQNAPHKTVFGAWSVRSRVGAQVSTPFYWSEIDEIHPDDLTMDIVPDRLASGGDPWSDMYDNPNTIEPLLAMYQADVDVGLGDAPWPPVYPKMPNEPPRVAPSRAKATDDDA